MNGNLRFQMVARSDHHIEPLLEFRKKSIEMGDGSRSVRIEKYPIPPFSFEQSLPDDEALAVILRILDHTEIRHLMRVIPRHFRGIVG
jgi:hypothetical protein